MTYMTYPIDDRPLTSSSLRGLPQTPATPFQLLVHELLVHDQKGTKSVKVVREALATEVVGKVSYVCSFTDINEVCHPIAIKGDLREHTSVSPLRDALEILRHITPINSHSRYIRVHAGA